MQYDGRIDFEYPKEKLENLARRSGEYGSLVDSGIFFWLNVTDWYSGMNRTGWAGTIITSSQVKLKWIGERIRTFKPRSTMKIQVMWGFVYVCVERDTTCPYLSVFVVAAAIVFSFIVGSSSSIKRPASFCWWFCCYWRGCEDLGDCCNT